MLDLLAKLERIEKKLDRYFGKPIVRHGPGQTWPDQITGFCNRKTFYKPHHDDEYRFVIEDGPWSYGLAKGGEGGGKSVAGIVKTLWRLRRGMSGIMVSPDLEHFKKSLWKEFRNWCPVAELVPEHRHRLAKHWEPSQSFTLLFRNGSELICGGIKEPGAWEGPNVHFAYFDEARRHKTPTALKVLDGRVRLAGSNNEPPQLYLTTTPRKHWLYDYFGDKGGDEDEFELFKLASLVITLKTAENRHNLAEGYVERRQKSLTEAEASVLLGGEWLDIDDIERFLPSITWWDACFEEVSPLDSRTRMVLAADAAVSGDCFAVVGVSRHPHHQEDSVVVRYVGVWEPPKRGKIDYLGTLEQPGPEREIRRLCKEFYVAQVAYDSYQLHDMMTRLQREGVAWTKEFGQQAPRLSADKQLLDLISQKRITHNGDERLRKHIDNADRKPDPTSRKIRIVKRSKKQKIDLVVALSMASSRCLELNL
jgi:hypothetical protein